MPKGKQRAKSAVYDELTPAEIREALARRKAQHEEYGQWVASMDITVPFQASLAYTKGSPVPASNVERWDYDSPYNYMGAVCVVPADSDEGKALLDPNSTTARVAAVADGFGSDVHPDLLADLAADVETPAVPAADTTTTTPAAARSAASSKEAK